MKEALATAAKPASDKLETALKPAWTAEAAYDARVTAPASAAEFSGTRECGHWRS